MNSRAVAKFKRVDYMSENFEWDEPSIEWAEKGFTWEGHENNTDEVLCDSEGMPV